MDYTVSLTAAEAAERLLSIKLGFVLLCVLAVCFTFWLVVTNADAVKRNVELAKRIRQQAREVAKEERKEWIKANCELAAKVDSLQSENKMLMNELTRMREQMGNIKVAELRRNETK